MQEKIEELQDKGLNEDEINDELVKVSEAYEQSDYNI